jgi:cytochrome P450
MSVQSRPAAHTESALPPGPRLPVFVQTWLLRIHPRRYLRWCRARYGATFTVTDVVGGPHVFVTDPEHLKAVFAGSPAVLRAGEANAVLGPVLGHRSVLLLDGAEHRDRRRLMVPAFHGGQVWRQEALMREVVTAQLAGWPVGTPFRANERTRVIALEIILRVVLGVAEPQRLARLRAALPRVVDLHPADLLMITFPRLANVGRWRRYWEHKAVVDAMLDEEIALRRGDQRLAERDDVLSSLVAAYLDAGQPTDDGELRDQLITLLLAGHETTATALAWSLELLARNRAEQDRLAASVAAGSSDYAGAVVTEVLRLRPVIDFVGRRVAEPFPLRGHGAVRARTVICPAISLVHDDPAQHPQPRRFRPERWLGAGQAQGVVLPFGGGARRCLGAPFAVAELRVALEEIVRRYEVHPVGRRPERPRMRHITSVPSRGARIVITPRKRTTSVDLITPTFERPDT